MKGRFGGPERYESIPQKADAMRRFLGWVVVTTVSGLISGCGEGDIPSGGAILRDSAGIRIVESSEVTRFPAPWTIGDSPDWVVGELEGEWEYLLSRVVGAMTLIGGEVVIGNGDTNELRFYDEGGRWTRTLGGTGEGPGEFEYLRALGPCYPDGFVAFDLNWQKNSYLMDGSFVEKTVLKAPSGVTPYSLACDDRGNVMMLGWGRAIGSGPIVGFYQAHDRLVLAGDDGEVKTEFGERLASERIGSTGGSRPHPAGRATRFAIHAGSAYIGSGERCEVEVWSVDGNLRGLIRGPRIALEVTDSVKQAYLEARLTETDESRHAAIRSSVAEWEWPQSLPAFTDLRVDGAGVVWVKRFSVKPDEPETWSLLHPERAYLGDLRLAPRQSLLEIGEDYLLLLSRDELDVERVERVPLDRGNDS